MTEESQSDPIRGWGKRSSGPLIYRKFSDSKMRVIAFKIVVAPTEVLPEGVLDLMRSNMIDKEGQSTGLVFKNSRTYGPIWTVPDDPVGRTLADRIESQLSELAKKNEVYKGR